MPKVETFDKTLALKNAMEVFQLKGYHGTSMQDLVEAMGLNRSSIYNSFGCKLTLFLETLKVYSDFYSDKTAKALTTTTTALERIQCIFDLFIEDIIADTNSKGCLLVNVNAELGHQEASVAQFLYQKNQNTTLFLEQIITEGQEKGDFNTNKSSKEYAIYLLSALQGLRITGIFNTTKTDLQSIVNTTITTIL